MRCNQTFIFTYVTLLAAEKLHVHLYKTVKISRNSYRMWTKNINMSIEIAK